MTLLDIATIVGALAALLPWITAQRSSRTRPPAPPTAPPPSDPHRSWRDMPASYPARIAFHGTQSGIWWLERTH